MNRTVFSFLLVVLNIGGGRAQSIDVTWLKSINANNSLFSNNYAKVNANLVKPVTIGVPAIVAVAGLVKKNNNLKKDALYMAATSVATGAITYAIKHTAKRPRPYQKYAFITLRTKADDNVSMPSGHTSLAFNTATNVALRYKKWYVVAPAYLYASSAAWARMQQGMHYPSDVLAGATLGTVCAGVSYKAQTKWLVKKNKPTTGATNTSF
jgi:membrane-associated phospholipid phosphatase